MGCRRSSLPGLLLLMGALLAACGQHQRDNPFDPEGDNRNLGGGGIELIAALPQGDIPSERLVEFRYQVSEINAQGREVVLSSGTMNRVGESARAQVVGVLSGPERIFRVDAFDATHIRTFTAEQRVAVGPGYPQVVRFALQRLRGELELTAELPPEVDTLEVVIQADGDSLRHRLGAVQARRARIDNIPTGADVRLILRARDPEGRVLLQRLMAVDIRDGLLARLILTMEVGALQVVAHFPEYLGRVQVDRFSDQAGTLYRRAERPELPGPDMPIDFDQENLFYFKGFGPDGEEVGFYNLDVQADIPGPVYFLVDPGGDRIEGQLAIFDRLPGEEGYSDLCEIHQVAVDRGFKANQLTSLDDILEGEYTITPTGKAMNCVIVPQGSTARYRFDATVPTDTIGWYRGQIVSYLLFENPETSSPILLTGERIESGTMYAFLENDRNFLKGFARESGPAGTTHNVVARLPGTEGDYSPLWLLRILKYNVFDQVTNYSSAFLQNPENFHPLDSQQLKINAPIVWVKRNQ